MSLYTPYKAVGVVTDGKPFVVNHLGEETFISVTIGSLFQVYRTDKLTVCLVARETPNAEIITALQVAGNETFCAVGKSILVYDRTRLVRKYDEHSAAILGLCMVGRMLLSWDSAGQMCLIDTQKRTMLSELQSLQDSSISAVAHPATYLNKFLVGYANGALELWNMNKQRLIYTFVSHLSVLGSQPEEDEDNDFFARNVFNKEGKAATSVTSMEQSPAVDVFGVGFSDGTIILLNLKLDKVLF
jgi:U3 small nucleolar RNA-associated protein 21